MHQIIPTIPVSGNRSLIMDGRSQETYATEINIHTFFPGDKKGTTTRCRSGRVHCMLKIFRSSSHATNIHVTCAIHVCCTHKFPYVASSQHTHVVSTISLFSRARTFPLLVNLCQIFLSRSELLLLANRIVFVVSVLPAYCTYSFFGCFVSPGTCLSATPYPSLLVYREKEKPTVGCRKRSNGGIMKRGYWQISG